MCMNAVCVLNHFIFVFLQLYNDLCLGLGGRQSRAEDEEEEVEGGVWTVGG